MFGGGSANSGSGGYSSYSDHVPEMSDIKDSVRQGMIKVTEKISSMRSYLSVSDRGPKIANNHSVSTPHPSLWFRFLLRGFRRGSSDCESDGVERGRRPLRSASLRIATESRRKNLCFRGRQGEEHHLQKFIENYKLD